MHDTISNSKVDAELQDLQDGAAACILASLPHASTPHQQATVEVEFTRHPFYNDPLYVAAVATAISEDSAVPLPCVAEFHPWSTPPWPSATSTVAIALPSFQELQATLESPIEYTSQSSATYGGPVYPVFGATSSSYFPLVASQLAPPVACPMPSSELPPACATPYGLLPDSVAQYPRHPTRQHQKSASVREQRRASSNSGSPYATSFLGVAATSATLRASPSTFECKWAMCQTVLASAKLLAEHVLQTHIHDVSSKTWACYWRGCSLKRRRIALLAAAALDAEKPSQQDGSDADNAVAEASVFPLFNRRQKFLAHVRTHTDERPYPCPACASSFRRKDTRSEHITKMHLGSSKRLLLEILQADLRALKP